MRRVILLFGAVLSLSVAAAAQENTVSFAPPRPAAAPASPQGLGGSDANWQVAAGYQYNRLHIGTTTVTTNGFHASLVRYLRGPFGLEGDLGTGFGNTGAGATTGTLPKNLIVKTVFVGGGAHLSFARESRVEPWVHVLVGLEHYRFTQTATLGTANTVAWTLGGGADWHLNSVAAIRMQGDYLGTRFNSVRQSNFQLVMGLVLNF